MPKISHRVKENDKESDSDIDDVSLLSSRDKHIRGYRDVENISKFNIIVGMIKTRQNVKNNKDLMPIYMRSKQLFDEIVEEQNKQVTYLQNIIRHLDSILHDHLSPPEGQITTSKKHKKVAKSGSNIGKQEDHVIQDIIKEKQKVGRLLIKMRMVLNKLNEIDALTHITPERMAAFSPADFNIQMDDNVDHDGDVDGEDIVFMLNDPNEQFYSSSDEGDSDDTDETQDGESDEDHRR